MAYMLSRLRADTSPLRIPRVVPIRHRDVSRALARHTRNTPNKPANAINPQPVSPGTAAGFKGVTGLEGRDGVPVPTALKAVTAKVYEVLLISPATTALRVELATVAPALAGVELTP